MPLSQTGHMLSVEQAKIKYAQHTAALSDLPERTMGLVLVYLHA